MNKLRQDSIRARVMAVELMRSGSPDAAESFWRAHLERMRRLVLAAYAAPRTIDVLSAPTGRLRAVTRVRRDGRTQA